MSVNAIALFLGYKPRDIALITNKNTAVYDATFPASIPVGRRWLWRRTDVVAWKFKRDMDAVAAGIDLGALPSPFEVSRRVHMGCPGYTGREWLP